ncbi:pyridoxal phosphate-dependent transferase [Xylariaceae sp. FL0255]|nr:pyridoxal phosphate-dependent transferase [Xylariaceae sp. FL0255]
MVTADNPVVAEILTNEVEATPETPVKIDEAAPTSPYENWSLSAKTIHVDDVLNTHSAVAPPMHVSTTFRYSQNPDDLIPDKFQSPDNPKDLYIYSRASAPNTSRLETILSEILHGPTLTYSSGLSAYHAMLVYINPKRIAIGDGYHGCHGVIALLSKLTGLKTLDLDCADSELGPGDVIHVETPLNPTGEARNLAFYAEKAKRTGAYLTVDATFAPPPLQDPFAFGADFVMHSGTKYFGGHSDMLCGTLTVAPRLAAKAIPVMGLERLVLGSVMGSFEGWLGVRSLRTLELRVRKQSADAEKLVRWLADKKVKEESVVRDVVTDIKHASLQVDEKGEVPEWLRKQMPQGYGPVFSIVLASQDMARNLPSKLHMFHHATSLGGVESLIEWRAMTDPSVDKRLLRLSVGIEGWEDLRDDLLQGFEALTKEKSEAA